MESFEMKEYEVVNTSQENPNSRMGYLCGVGCSNGVMCGTGCYNASGASCGWGCEGNGC